MGAWAYGILPCAQHLNPAGVVHGGLLMSLIDHVLSAIAWEAVGRRICVTIQMETKLLSAARENHFLKATGHVTHATGSLVFVDGEIHSGENAVLRASALLKIMSSAA
ncbi:PaaI family thioesterase [Variovorax sp. RT4R15]|uniref:PaaI family thioesterase n=1 Tax=Variovorax sp. RT4R15 TaxID=3443737 RepID=UPI003F492C2A